MRIEKKDGLFVATCTYDQRHLFRAAGWYWHPNLKRWTTQDVSKVVPHFEFAVGEARKEVEAFKRTPLKAIAESMAHDTDVEIPAPEGLSYLPYQRAGIAYAYKRKDTLIADPPGLGKTIQGIGVANMDSKAVDILIVCPASLKRNWKREFEKWDIKGLSVGIAGTKLVDVLDEDGNPVRDEKGKKKKQRIDVFPDTDVVIINFEMLPRFEADLKGFMWDLVIVDEAHNLKNKASERAKRVFGHGRGKKRIQALVGRRRIFLTGTPITAKPIDMWVFCEAFDPNGLGRNWKTFVYRYCDASDNGFGLDTSGASNLDELQMRLRQAFMVRRNKKEVLKDLPPKRREMVILPNDGLTKAIAEEMNAVRKALDEFERMMGLASDPQDDGDLLRSLALLTKDINPDAPYREIVESLGEGTAVAFDEISTFRKKLALAKLPMVKDHVDRLLETGEKVIVFCYHKEVAAALRESYPKSAFVTGATAVNRRQDEVDRFQTDEDCRVFIGNINAAGVGFTLTAASIVVFAELCWLPSDLEQAEDRAWRIGQENAVLVQHLVVEDSLEARMAQIIVERMDMIEQALDDAALAGKSHFVLDTADSFSVH